LEKSYSQLYKALEEKHKDIRNLEFYLCGSPAMIQAVIKMPSELNVGEESISFDDF